MICGRGQKVSGRFGYNVVHLHCRECSAENGAVVGGHMFRISKKKKGIGRNHTNTDSIPKPAKNHTG